MLFGYCVCKLKDSFIYYNLSGLINIYVGPLLVFPWNKIKWKWKWIVIHDGFASCLFNFMKACRSWWINPVRLTGRTEFIVEFWGIAITDVLHFPGKCRQISLPGAGIFEPLNYPRLLKPVFKVTSSHTTREVPMGVAGRWLWKGGCSWHGTGYCLYSAWLWAASLGRSMPSRSQSMVLAKMWSVILCLCQAWIKHS